jgi:enamine deaminase RidA (YjgF/YER057c/UK114 family)
MWSAIQPQLNQIGLKLPDSPAPRGQYSAVTVHNGIAYVAGQVSRLADDVITGPVDQTTSPDKIKFAAQTCVLRALSVLTTLEDSYVIDRILFLRGYVYASSDFTSHSAVLDHASDLLHALFGERGRHARSAIGVSSLPSAGLLEIELVVAVTPKPLASSDEDSFGADVTLPTGDLQ